MNPSPECCSVVGDGPVVHRCLAAWVDLVGFTDMLRPGNLDLTTEAAKAAMKRLKAFLDHGRDVVSANPMISALAVNDGILYCFDIEEGREIDVPDVLFTMVIQHGVLMAEDLAQGYAGARMVICQGQRADLNLAHGKVHPETLTSLKEMVATIEAGGGLAANCCSLVARAMPLCPAYLQTNMAFAKAYLAERDLKANRVEFDLAIECELIDLFCGSCNGCFDTAPEDLPDLSCPECPPMGDGVVEPAEQGGPSSASNGNGSGDVPGETSPVVAVGKPYLMKHFFQARASAYVPVAGVRGCFKAYRMERPSAFSCNAVPFGVEHMEKVKALATELFSALAAASSGQSSGARPAGAPSGVVGG